MKEETVRDLKVKLDSISPGTLIAFNTDTKRGEEAYFFGFAAHGLTVITKSGHLAIRPWASFKEVVFDGIKIDLKDEGLVK